MKNKKIIFLEEYVNDKPKCRIERKELKILVKKVINKMKNEKSI